ncbi:MAG TPA: sigma factor-like helix-turn-helix DNA-binding protein [Coriobacteriia bacterium]|nr:sigma factor-like helix-turn-helix DNA-binding protein [Coriobacteriia bacterium]
MDDRVWSVYQPIEIVRLTDLAASAVQGVRTSLPPKLGLAQLQDLFALEGGQVDLTVRTRNCLGRAGLNTWERLGAATISEILSIGGFGALSFMDLLTSIESISRLNPLEDSIYSRRRVLEPLDLGSRPLDVALREVLCQAAKNERASEMMLLRHGWGGTAPLTLEETARRFGVTRERIRQICKKVESRILEAGVAGTALTDALAVAGSSIPMDKALLERTLLTQGLVQDAFSVESLLDAARFFGAEASFRIRGDQVVSLDSVTDEDDIGDAIHSLMSRCSIRAYADLVCAAGAEESHDDDLRHAIDEDPELLWLDDERSWVGMPSLVATKDRVGNRLRKALAMADTALSIESMVDAVGRDRRGVEVPSSVMQVYATNSPWLQQDGARFAAAPPLRGEEVLQGAELQLVRALRDEGGIAHLHDLWSVAYRLGVGKVNFHRLLAESPCVVKHGPCVYGLRGADVSANEVYERVREVEKHRAVRLGGSGPVTWVLWRLAASGIRMGRCSLRQVPSGLVEGTYDVRVDESGPSFPVRVEDNIVCGALGSLLRVIEASSGRLLLLVLDGASMSGTGMLVGDQWSIADDDEIDELVGTL